jgi:hypothetical protein
MLPIILAAVGGYLIVDSLKNDSTKFAEGGLVAPNGKKSNLTPEQYKLVRTPEFKAFFGDWENDPKNASKVVDENGEPLVVYHGSYYNFNIFKTKNDSQFFFTNTLELAKHFSEGEDDDEIYHKGKIYKVFLNLKNPKSDINEAYGIYQDLVDKYENGEIEENIILESSEGAILFYENWHSFKTYKNVTNYVVFNSNQIKLADGSNTTFDSTNPDIRYADGGMMARGGRTGQNFKASPAQVKKLNRRLLEKGYGDFEFGTGSGALKVYYTDYKKAGNPSKEEHYNFMLLQSYVHNANSFDDVYYSIS